MAHNRSSFSSFAERKGQETQHYQKVLDLFSRSAFEVRDVSENSLYYDKDIDFIVTVGDWVFSVEVKIDSRIGKTGNLFLEIVSNESKASMGCFLVSKADIFLYYDPDSGTVDMYPLKQLQQWFFDIRGEFSTMKDIDTHMKLQSTHTRSHDGSYSHTTIGRLINRKRLIQSLQKKSIVCIVTTIDDAILFDDVCAMLGK